jgi:hypothetical protein
MTLYNRIFTVKQSLMTSDVRLLMYVALVCKSYVRGKYYLLIKMRHKKRVNSVIIFATIIMANIAKFNGNVIS